jgi:hypothetical protein
MEREGGPSGLSIREEIFLPANPEGASVKNSDQLFRQLPVERVLSFLSLWHRRRPRLEQVVLDAKDKQRILSVVEHHDECDTLFESRQTGNVLMNILLTEIEHFEGLAILATNRPGALDPALERHPRQGGFSPTGPGGARGNLAEAPS